MKNRRTTSKSMLFALQFTALASGLLSCGSDPNATVDGPKKWQVHLAGDYEFSEQAFGSSEFMNNDRFFLLSEVPSMDTAIFGTQFYLTTLELNDGGALINSTPKLFPSSRKEQIIDSLQLAPIDDARFEVYGQSTSKKIEGVFFHKKYKLQLNDTTSLLGEIIGRIGNSSFVVSDTSNMTIASFELLDGPNYFIKMIDLNKDGINECLLYNCLLNETTLLKVFTFKEIP